METQKVLKAEITGYGSWKMVKLHNSTYRFYFPQGSWIGSENTLTLREIEQYLGKENIRSISEIYGCGSRLVKGDGNDILKWRVFKTDKEFQNWIKQNI